MESRLSLMREQVLHLGAAERVTVHRTPVFKLVVGVDHDLVLRCGDRVSHARAVLVPPMVAHALEAPGIALGLFFGAAAWGATSPDVRAGIRALAPRTLTRVVGWAQELARDSGRSDSEGAREGASLLGMRHTRPVDGRVAGTLRRLAGAPDASVASLAAAVRLSPERLRHLVVDETGAPLRAHRAFLRALRATQSFAAGETISEAAAAAGFADHAHLTRTFRRCFGRLPSERPARLILHAAWA